MWLKRTPLDRFLIKGGLLYILWRFYRKFSIIHDLNGELTDRVADFFLFVAKLFLYILGEKPQVDYVQNTLELSASSSVVVVYTCMGVNIILMFIFFLIAYPGNLKSKLWFAPVGITIIMLLNAIRMGLLCWTLEYFPEKFDLMHHFIFQGMLYFSVFLLWILWVIKWANPKSKISQEQNDK